MQQHIAWLAKGDQEHAHQSSAMLHLGNYSLSLSIFLNPEGTDIYSTASDLLPA